jgi:uncharacterized protein
MRLQIGRPVVRKRGLLVWGLLVGGLLWGGLLSGGSAHAQYPTIPNMVASDGISVYGTGEVAARPNWVEIDLQISGKAELTGDALVKYRDAKKRLVDALGKLGLEELSTEERGVSIGAGMSSVQQQQIINGIPQNQGKPQIEVSSTVRVRLKNIRDANTQDVLKTVGRLIDVAQDAGVSIGLSAVELQQLRQRYGNYSLQGGTDVRFVVPDLDELREKAYERAVSDARDRASRLAKLNHVKLGAAVSVQEIQVAGDVQTTARSINPYAAAAAPEVSDEPRISSTTLSDIPVQVKLLVRFAIQAADPATAQK